MRAGAALTILFILLASSAAWPGASGSPASLSDSAKVGGIGTDQADSMGTMAADTLLQGAADERSVMDRLIVPILITAAVGGLLIILFTRRG